MKHRPPEALGNVLVVDDDEMNRDMLSRRLARKGFDVVVAEDGSEALALVAETDFDLILLDIMMPGIDGLQVLERLRREHSPVELPVIMATAKDESEDVVYALKLGANDYVTKPLDFPVVLARVTTQLSLRRATRDLEAAHARMKKDLDAAARVQRAMMPASMPEMPGSRFAWKFTPCDEPAGDILDVFKLDDERIGLYLLDVSGHGVPAALLSVTLSRVLSHMEDGSMLSNHTGAEADTPALESLAPATVARRLNSRFPMSLETRQYFTIVYGILDPAKRELSWMAAAHPGPLHIDARGRAQVHQPTGPAIGWFPDADFEQRSLSLRAGDRVYLFSDGVVEAANYGEEQFGLDRITEVLTACRTESLDASLETLLGEVGAWCGDRGPDDDISLLAFELD